MVDALEGIRQLEQDRNRAVGELQRLQRHVARRDEQDKEASKASEQRRIEMAERIDKLEKETEALKAQVSKQKHHPAQPARGRARVHVCDSYRVSSLVLSQSKIQGSASGTGVDF